MSTLLSMGSWRCWDVTRLTRVNRVWSRADKARGKQSIILCHICPSTRFVTNHKGLRTFDRNGDTEFTMSVEMMENGGEEGTFQGFTQAALC